MSATLYELGASLERIYAQLEESGGELTPEMEVDLEAVSGDFADKVERVALMIRQFQASAEVVKMEEARLAKRRAARENSAESLKAYVLAWMRRVDRLEVKRPLATVRVQDSPPSAHLLVPVDALPDSLVRVVPEQRVFDAQAAIALHRAGRPLPEGVKITTGVHLRIY